MEIINIVVPVYNVEKYLSRCIDSLLSQTYTDIRIILVDDGSLDSSKKICDNYSLRDSRVVSLHRSNGGLSAARNTGIDYIFSLDMKVRGQYVVFVDSDDWVEPDYVSFLYALLQSSNTDIAQCGYWITYSENNQCKKSNRTDTMILNQIDAIESLCRNSVYDVTSWNKIYNINLFSTLRFPEGMLYEDTATTYLLTCQCNFVAVNMTPKYHYVQRYTSIANGLVWKDSKLDLVRAGDQMSEWVKTNYPQLDDAATEKQAFVRLSTLSQMVNTGYGNKDVINQLRREVLKIASTVMLDPKASKRDKLGILALIPGYWCYRAIWSRYYAAKRNKSTIGILTLTNFAGTGKDQS